MSFASADGKTTLVGYLFKPASERSAQGSARFPAIVMMHGRAGAYSERANGVFDATTLSLRHKAWGREWADAGYAALLVDGFGPRGYPQGFPRFSYDSRPEVLNEMTVRPLDANGALAYLRRRADVIADRIGLQGWSNGGSATIATMSFDAPGIASPTPKAGFRAALAFYPGCGLKAVDDNRLPLSNPLPPSRSIPVRRTASTAGPQPAEQRCQCDGTEDAVARALQFFARYVGGARD